MEVLEMVKQSAVQVNLSGAAHTKRLLSFLEEDRKSMERWKMEIAEHGLLWFIQAKDVLKFRYHVNLRDNVIMHCGQNVRYIGDIPDFALDRAELATKLHFWGITLHSMNPLPVERVNIDPVMIGWLQDPGIRIERDGSSSSHYPTAEGVVLAIWSNEKELEL